MARSGLSDLLLQLRGMTDAGTADYTIGTASYWDSDQLQVVLDRNRRDVQRELLTPVQKHVGGGTVQYLEYRSQFGNFEQTTGGTAIFVVETSTGSDASTANYSVDYARGIVTFTSDQAGTSYYLTGRAYDLNGAAADVWRMKAANSAKLFNFSTDNHSLSRAQLMEHCLQMADYYAGQQEAGVVTMYRSDN